MTINSAGNSYYVKLDMLPTSSKQEKKTVYVNPKLIEMVEPTSKKMRLKESYSFNGSDSLTESRITLASGKEIFVSEGARTVASLLGGASKTEAHILDING